MLPDVETLLVVQDRDQKIAALRKDIANIPKLVEHAKTRLKGDLEAAAKLKEEIRANEIVMKGLDLDIQTRQNTIDRLKTQQFETRKNEEFRALGAEVERYQREVNTLEDKQLGFMEIGENQRKRLKELEAALAKTQEVVDKELGLLEERKKVEERQIAELEKEKATFVQRVPEDVLSIYTRLLKNKGDAALAALENGQCKGCHMKVTSANILKVKAEQEITHCTNCGRILYLND